MMRPLASKAIKEKREQRLQAMRERDGKEGSDGANELMIKNSAEGMAPNVTRY
jgi:hypothetical protein